MKYALWNTVAWPQLFREGEGGDGGGGSLLTGAGEGGDTAPSGDGGDTLASGDGGDTLEAGGGDDTLEGGDGDDTAASGSGDDGVPPAPLTVEDLALGDDVEVNEEAMTSFLEVMNNEEFTPAERARELINLQATTMETAIATAQEAVQQQWDEQQDEWQNAVRAMPEIGGDNLDESLATIKQGLRQAGATDETFAALDATGAGNHPEIIRVLHALTKGLKEGGPVTGEPPRANLSQADKMFGTN